MHCTCSIKNLENKDLVTIEQIRCQLYDHPIEEWLYNFSISYLKTTQMRKNYQQMGRPEAAAATKPIKISTGLEDIELRNFIQQEKRKGRWPKKRGVIKKFAEHKLLKKLRRYSSSAFKQVVSSVYLSA